METQKKRALTKVRRDFLFKKAEGNEEKDIDPATRCLSNNQVNIIAGDIGLVEINREICLEMYYANLQYRIDHFEIEQRSRCPVIHIELKPANFHTLLWDYTVKRLESYGDLELATWAHRIKKSQSSHVKSMRNYYDLFKLNDPKMLTTINEAKERAELLCKELESKHSFFKIRYFANQDSKNMVSTSFDEDFLKGIGYNIQEFGDWVVKNGLPIMTEKNSTTNIKYGQALLDCNLIDFESVFEGPEQSSKLVDKNGFKKDCQMQTVLVLEPSIEGVYMNTYYVLKDKAPNMIKANNRCLKSYKPFIEELREKFLDTHFDSRADRISVNCQAFDPMQEESDC